MVVNGCMTVLKLATNIPLNEYPTAWKNLKKWSGGSE